MQTVLTAALLLSSASSALAYKQNFIGAANYDQSFKDGYNPIKWSGGLGPYSNRQAVGISRDPPAGCEVDQVIMLHRHGTRYPEASSGVGIEAALKKFDDYDGEFQNELKFYNDWEYFVPSDGYYGLEISSSPYSGLGQAYKTGGEYRKRYGHLWDGDSWLPFFAGGYDRVLETGRFFAAGFTGYNYTDLAAVNVIDETSYAGANSVAPTCNAKNKMTQCLVANQSEYSSVFLQPEFEVAANRLNKEYPGLNLNATNVFYLLQAQAFETAVRGVSPWLNVFTNEELVAYEYAMGLLFYCYFGPEATGYGMPMGSVYANATLSLLNQTAEENGGISLFFSFSHDSYITSALAAIGVLVADDAPPLDHVDFKFLRTFKLSDVVPMGAHLTIERLQCTSEAAGPYLASDKLNGTAVTNGTTAFGNGTSYNSTSSSSSSGSNSTYVRLVLNEAVLPFDGCTDGPGWACPLDKYMTLVQNNIAGYNYVEDCQVAPDRPQYLDFFWNWNKTTENNFHNGTWAYQATFVTN